MCRDTGNEARLRERMPLEVRQGEQWMLRGSERRRRNERTKRVSEHGACGMSARAEGSEWRQGAETTNGIPL